MLARLLEAGGLGLELRLELRLPKTSRLWLLKASWLRLLEARRLWLLEARILRLLLRLLEARLLWLLLGAWEASHLRLQSAWRGRETCVLLLQRWRHLLSEPSLLRAKGGGLAREGLLLLRLLTIWLLAAAVRAAQIGVGAGKHRVEVAGWDVLAGLAMIHVATRVRRALEVDNGRET